MDIESLVSPLGVVGSVRRLPKPRGMSRLDFHIGSAGRVVLHSEVMTGVGRVLDDPELARIVAIAESAERYAGEGLHPAPIWSTLAELDGPVMDTARIPRCSTAEYAHPRCPLVPFDERARIRWVKGVDLVSGQELWVPAVMVSYGLHPEPAEHFWYQISTGHAVHTDPARALTGAIMEIIERDSIALLWLQQLPLAPVAPDVLTEGTRYLLDWCERHFIRAMLFDATTDLGVPIVYSLHIAEHDGRAMHVAGCAADASIGVAAEKATIEAATVRTVFRSDDPIPDDLADFGSMHGARYMAMAERAGAFGFLVDGIDERRPSPGPPDLPENPLDHLVELLAAQDMQVIAVDRTSTELADAGLTAVTVVIPDLIPMSLLPLAQFRAHPRLSTAPARMGYRCLKEEDLNPWPQPFS